ncbi:hypothetical protein DAPPUDRAFT_270110 [Daphnia pulex]|uniref:Uncharacterized protein n=1 Tax=Daphnia pulex TaxID=6669 RepID=E9I066_DAPPU|nr:hypothetical protein DAPPUDRAFT_270110 [Daphnia pulex]|eukprot:EFX62614.1 hypothetical protein DAPPUDRAFT_270110 [Daphnia pulex]
MPSVEEEKAIDVLIDDQIVDSFALVFNFEKGHFEPVSVELAGHQLLAGQGLDDDVQTGQNGVGLGQEVAVGQQFVLGDVGELGEHLLVFGMGLDEAEKNLRRNIAVPLCLVLRMTLRS